VYGGKYDEMVRVGTFWIDRYELTLWSQPNCATTALSNESDEASQLESMGFAGNGNWSVPVYACSVAGHSPSRFLTFFQAQQGCALSGKRLCTNGEWQAAAAGTADPGSWPDSNTADGCTQNPEAGKCSTCAKYSRVTGNAQGADLANSCMSSWGAFDMIGNAWELVDLWGQAGRDMGIAQAGLALPWPASYGSDGTWNVNGEAGNGVAWKTGLPASALRGGGWSSGSAAGVFAFFLGAGASAAGGDVGARCCR